MRIYLAGSAARQLECRIIRDGLELRGHVVKSTWLDMCDVGYGEGSAARLANMALIDFAEVVEADCVVVLTGDTLTRGGRHSEVGIALALGKRVYLYGGGREQVFHYHPLCSVLEVLDGLE